MLTRTGVRIAVGSTEIGQGTRTMHAQIVADALGIPYETSKSRSRTRRALPTADRQSRRAPAWSSARFSRSARIEMKEKLGRHSRRPSITRSTARCRWSGCTSRPTGSSGTTRPIAATRTRHTAGDATSSSWSSIRDTFEVRPIKLTAVQEFGRPIHPALARGQIEGGTAQGLGYALLERVVMRNGAMANAQLTNYMIPTTLDMPEIDVVMMENPYPGGPFGAKGLGELPMDGPAPAVVNALAASWARRARDSRDARAALDLQPRI